MNSATISASALIKIATQLTDGQLQTLSAQAPTGLLSETFLFPGAERRAGRARSVAEAQGADVPLAVKLPRVASLMTQLGGAGIGAMAGGLLGSTFKNESQYASSPDNAVPGALIGAGVGSIAGAIATAIYRRRQATKVFEGSKGKNLNVNKITMPSRLTSLTSGIHHQGRADVARALSEGTTRFPNNDVMTYAKVMASVPYFGLPAAPVVLGGSAVHTGESREAIRNAQV